MTKLLTLLHAMDFVVAPAEYWRKQLKDAAEEMLIRASISLPSATEDEQTWKANYAARSTLMSCICSL